MKRLAIPVLIFLLLIVGCAKPINTRIPPLSYIDSVSSSQIYAGDKIKFTGHGVSTVGEIVAYNWRSSINGDLSKVASFETTNLSAGSHTIWFRVQDNYGNWSDEVGTNVNVLAQGGPTKMQIKVFSGIPLSITQGDWATLAWDVSGDGTVSISPDIGNVASSGSRDVRPMQDTIYTITGTNDVGVVTATCKITVTALPTYTLDLYPVTGECGTVRKDKVVLDSILVGQNESQVPMQAFLSYDISNIPPGAIISSVQLDLSAAQVYGSPFPFLGSMDIYNQQYGSALQSNDYAIIVPAGYVYKWSYNSVITLMPQLPFSSPDFVNAMQKQVDARSDRFQLRIQFEKPYYYGQPNYSYLQYTYNVSVVNYIDIGVGKPRLTVRYMMPQ